MNQLSLLFVVVLTVHLVVAPKGVNGNLFDFLFGSSSTPSPSTNSPTTPSCGPRFRKPWLLYTPDEKAAYLEAISLAMKNRHYIQFVELHIDRLSEAEAHGNGAFLYWHRLMLLGFENMLRSYGPKYACITVPYWDYISESANVGACQTVGNCSMLAQDTGGAQFGFGSDFSPYGFNILGQTISGYKCVNQSILKNFCGDKTPVAQCGCLPRGDWFSAIHPASANYASIYRQLFPDPSSTSFNILTFTSSLEKGVHGKLM
jgi:tyrosinase